MGVRVKSQSKLVTPEECLKEGKERLIKAFKHAMRQQFRSHTKSGLPLNQFRDVCVTFALGWFESLKSQKDAVGAHYWVINFGNITSSDWWPGPEWVFWD